MTPLKAKKETTNPEEKPIGWQAWAVLSGILIVGAIVFVFVNRNKAASDGQVTPLGINTAAVEEGKQYTPVVGSFAPPFRLQDTDGQIVDLASMRSNKEIVFMTTSCTYCIQEIPDNNDIHAAGKVDFIMVDTGESRDSVARYRQEHGVNFPIYLDSNGEVANWYALQGTPTHFFVDESNKIVGKTVGFATRAVLDQQIARLLGDLSSK